MFAVAHLAIRRYAPYADPLLLPIVALLNGLGLVMIHRLDLDERLAEGSGRAVTNPQILCGRWSASALSPLVVILLKDHRQLARYGYVCGLTGLIILAIPGLLPKSLSEQNGAKIWIRLPGFSIQPAEFSKILLLIFFSGVLVAKRGLFTSAGKHVLGIDLPRPRDLAPLLGAWVTSIAVMVFDLDSGTSLLLYASFLVVVYLATNSSAGWYSGWHCSRWAAWWRTSRSATSGSGCRPGWIRSPTPTAPATRSCSRCSASPPGEVFGTGLGNGQPDTVPVAQKNRFHHRGVRRRAWIGGSGGHSHALHRS